MSLCGREGVDIAPEQETKGILLYTDHVVSLLLLQGDILSDAQIHHLLIDQSHPHGAEKQSETTSWMKKKEYKYKHKSLF